MPENDKIRKIGNVKSTKKKFTEPIYRCMKLIIYPALHHIRAEGARAAGWSNVQVASPVKRKADTDR